MSKKSKSSTLLRQISQLEAEIEAMRKTVSNALEVVREVRKKESELTGVEFYRDKYLQMLYGHKKLQEACGFATQSPGERRVIKRISRREMRRESKKIISQGLIDFELVNSMLHEQWALDDMYAEPLRDFMDSEYWGRIRKEEELEERYAELVEPDAIIADPFYFEDDIDDGGPYGMQDMY